MNADEWPVEQQVFESSRTVVRDHDVGRSQVRADVGISARGIPGFPFISSLRRAAQSMPPE